MKKNLLYLLLFTSFNLSAQTNDYLEFNGMQDGVRVSHLPSYNTITSELTVSAWFYQDASLLNNVDLGTINPVVSKHFRKPEPMSPLVFDCGPYMYGGASDFYYSIGGTSGYIRGNIPNMIVNDTWQHFLMSVKNDSLKLFIDGNLVESISIGSDFVFNTNPDDIEIGYRQDNPANNTYTFPGKIRHVFILNRGIEESELTTLMYGGPSLLDPNLLGYWVLDEGTGAIAYDLSPNLNNGIHQETLNWVSSNLVLDYCTLTVDKTSIFEGDSATITATLSEVSATETVIKFTPSGSALFDGDYTVNYSGKGAMSTDSVGYSSLAGIAIDASGNTYLVDQSDNSIQKWAPGDTIGTTVAGGNGWGSAANQLANPNGIAVDASGNVYVADSQNRRIQKWAPGDTTGTTVAGGNGYGSAANQFANPWDVAVDASGNVYVADTDNHRIQKWTPGDTIGTTVAGGNGEGSAANQLSINRGVAVDASGNLYIADRGNQRIQKWAPGATEGTTVAGGNGYGSAANQLWNPWDIAVDASGNLYIADNSNRRIQKWVPGATLGVTVARDLNFRIAITLDALGNIYVGNGYALIKIINNGAQIIIPAGQTSATMSVKSISDAVSESDETITLTPIATGAALASSADLSLTIVNIPMVTGVSSTAADGSYKQDVVIPITVSFSEIVTVTGTPQLALNTDSSGVVVNYSSGSGTNTLTFNYTIGAAENSPRLDYFGTNALTLNGGTINDAVGNAAMLTLASPGATTSLGRNKSIIIDTNIPTMTITATNPSSSLLGSSVLDGSSTGDETLTITFTSSEATTNFEVEDIIVTGGAMSDFASTSSSVYTAIFTPTLAGATSIKVAANTFTDAAGNNNTTAQFNWTYIVSTISLSINASTIVEGDSATITATLSAATSSQTRVSFDPSGTAGLIGDYLVSNMSNEGKVTATIAGGNGSGSAANQFDYPWDVAVDASGNIYVADLNNKRIQKWAPGDTTGTTVVGANQIGMPKGVAVDASGNIYISHGGKDGGKYYIQKWAPGDTTGTTVAGGNGSGSAANQFANPYDVAVDASGNVYIADRGNHRIQKWAPGDTTGTTVAGGNGQGSAANQLESPRGIAIDVSGNVYIADGGNHRIQKWAPGDTIGTTVAGGNGQGSAANQLNRPYEVAVDASGNVYIADGRNHRIQKWAPGATTGVAGGNGWGSAANQLANPYALAVDASGNVYVADSQNHRIQKVTNGPQIIIPSGQTSAAIIVKAISDGIGERDETIFLTPSATGATLTSSDAISLIINSTPPTMVITSEEGSDGFTSEDSTLSLSFTSNESTIDFSIEDITVTGGVISTFVAISETIYTATFTPLEEGDKTIDVAAGTFKNVVGNGNIAAAQFNWKYDIENSPQLSDVAFTLAENSVNGTSLGILEASDADGDTLTYLIISGNDAEAFSLDSVSGALTVSTSSALDFETTPAFNLAIQVSDGALSDSATVTINLTDVDETTLSLADASEMIYPNPTDGIVNIKMAEFKEATIYNLSGKRIMRSIDNRIDVSALSEGVYIIKLENRSGDRFSTRLIKE